VPQVADFCEQHFGEIVRPHLPRLLNRARDILGSDDLAWDAVQEALLSLWREGAFPQNLRGWLLRTVVYRSLHLSRTSGRRRKHETAACAANGECSHRDDPEVVVANRELCQRVHDAIEELPADFHRAFVLREVECLDYEAIAGQLQIPLGTVRSRLNRARAALRDALRSVLCPAEDSQLAQPCRASHCGCVQGQRPLEN
jgi:RNA polymerase sigma-70 factor (ECF subfamily)